MKQDGISTGENAGGTEGFVSKNCWGKTPGNAKPFPLTVDELELCVAGLRIVHRRISTLETPSELTAVVPRAEIRARYQPDGRTLAEIEVLFNSITVVNAPRHPLAAPGGPKQGGE